MLLGALFLLQRQKVVKKAYIQPNAGRNRMFLSIHKVENVLRPELRCIYESIERMNKKSEPRGTDV